MTSVAGTVQWPSPVEEFLAGDHSNPSFSLNNPTHLYSGAKSVQFQHHNSQLYSPYYHDLRPPGQFYGVIFPPPPNHRLISPRPPHCLIPRPGMPMVRASGHPVWPRFPTPPLGFRQVVAVMPPPPPPAAFPPPGHDMQLLRAKIVSQIEYYFSKINLVTDIFLRRNMDEEGWVPVKLIAGFRRVKKLTGDVKLVMDALRSSNVVEVVGEKVRRRGDWSDWIMHSKAVSDSRLRKTQLELAC